MWCREDWTAVQDKHLSDQVAGFRQRFVDGTLPMLIEHGWDHRRGGLVERFLADGSSADVPYRRVMLHARQLYVFATWGGKTGAPALIAHADRIYSYLTEQFWDHQEAGWIETVDLEGAPQGLDKDLYAHAFALFGLAAYHHRLGRPVAAVWINRSFEVLQQHFLRADGSYSDRMSRNFGDLAADRRSQNPHMHLLEAVLSLVIGSNSAVYADCACNLLTLFEDYFLDKVDSVVVEYLDAGFHPHKEDGHRLEPGHHYEWAWLLDWATRTLDDGRYRDRGLAILENGLALGWDGSAGGVFDEVDRWSGAPIVSSKRIWPLLELIKALAVFPERRARPAVERATLVTLEQATALLLKRYLQPDGRWIERFNADWTPADQSMPSSSAYHISMALFELERTTARD
jgi:mannose/cellobiose epimerase-like protein (N-acyl-D-glucosamine 2-epimerase family)